MDDLICHATHEQKAVQDTFRSNYVPLGEFLQTLFQQETLIFFNCTDEADHNAPWSLLEIVAHFEATVGERLERLVVQGGFCNVPSSSRSSPLPGLVDQGTLW